MAVMTFDRLVETWSWAIAQQYSRWTGFTPLIIKGTTPGQDLVAIAHTTEPALWFWYPCKRYGAETWNHILQQETDSVIVNVSDSISLSCQLGLDINVTPTPNIWILSLERIS